MSIANQLQHNSAAVSVTSSQCIEIGQIRSPRENRTVGPIEMPFGMFDYIGDLTKFPSFIAFAQLVKANDGAKYPCRILVVSYAFIIIFFRTRLPVGERP